MSGRLLVCWVCVCARALESGSRFALRLEGGIGRVQGVNVTTSRV